MNKDTLCAFYDLEVSPISFDFSVFLILAELARNRSKTKKLKVVIVPGSNTGFRCDDAAYDSDNKLWRLHNILLPATSLLNSNVTVDICTNREYAAQVEERHEGPIFPEGYSVANPISEFFLSYVVAASTVGETIPSFHAPPQARKYIQQWLNERIKGRKPVTITLREADYNENQNSNTDAWLEFAGSLDLEEFYPVFIRDTDKAFNAQDPRFDRFAVCIPAAINLQLRMALYELSWLNMLVPNGPGELCRHSAAVRYLYFKIINEGGNTTSKLLIASQGIEINGQLPYATKYQRLVWEHDDINVIHREFNSMAALINSSEDTTDALLSPQNYRKPIETAVQLHMMGRLEEATSIFQDIVQSEPENADAWHFLGIIANQAGHTDAAQKLILQAIKLNNAQANYYISLALVEKVLGNNANALAALNQAISVDPKDAGAHADLADLLHQIGEQSRAEAAMMTALKLAPGTVEYYERAGLILQASGNSEEAVKFFKKAIELRKEIEGAIREQGSHLSEIPQISLGHT